MKTQEPEEKKAYSKPNLAAIKLVPEEAFLTACKTGSIDFTCKEPSGIPLFDFGS